MRVISNPAVKTCARRHMIDDDILRCTIKVIHRTDMIRRNTGIQLVREDRRLIAQFLQHHIKLLHEFAGTIM